MAGQGQVPRLGHVSPLHHLMAAGAPGARSLTAVASRGGLGPASFLPVTSGATAAVSTAPPKPVQPITVAVDSFWQHYDVVYVIKCQNQYLSTYLE